MEQINFDEAPQIVCANEPHMALLFLLDTSSSMAGRPIEELNKGINKFKEQVCKDQRTKDILDIAVIEFGTDWKVNQEFTPVEYMKPVNLVANGGTNMKDVLTKSVEMVDERSRFYKKCSGTEPYKPWIVLISDGEPSDDISEVTKEINDKVAAEKLAFWSLAVPGANKEILHKLSGARVLNLEQYDFKGFFDWVNKSMRAVSVSATNEKPKGQDLPSTVIIDQLM